MPESVKDRPSKAHEQVFLFALQQSYFYDSDTAREPLAKSSVARLSQDVARQRGSTRAYGKTNGLMKAVGSIARGRNMRDVWDIPTQPFSGAHFAAFPPALPARCISAGCRPGGVVLDPFSGAGTTGMAATRLGRRYIGIDLNPDYLNLSLRTRLRQGILIGKESGDDPE
jgi:site-specific DNA-methyltransferase (cytosine-N4-specific)